MITRTNAYQASDGTTYQTLPEAQKQELDLILFPETSSGTTCEQEEVLTKIIKNAEKITAVLGVKVRKPRAKNGTKTKRNAAAISAATQDTKP